MTRKHFKELAEQLRVARPDSDDDSAMRGWRAAVFAVARACRFANPRFDEERFRAACGA